MVSAWVEHIKNFARRKNMTYGCALSDPDCKAEYHAKRPPKLNKKEKKEVAGMEAEDINILSIPVKKTRGRPKKYSTDEERKKAKTVKTVESNKRKRQEKKGMTGGMLSNILKKNDVNKIINFITHYVNTKTPDPEFERYIREDIGEDDIVSRFADTILGADIPLKLSELSQEDKLDLITDLNGYIKHYFPKYKDSNFKIKHIKKMRGVGVKGGAVPPIPPKIKRGKKSIVPDNQNVVINDNPPPPPPPPPPPVAPPQGRNRRRMIIGGNVNRKRARTPSPPPEVPPPPPLTDQQGQAVRAFIENTQPITPHRARLFENLIDERRISHNLRERFEQWYMNEYGIPRGRFRITMERFDGLMRLIRNFGAETDSPSEDSTVSGTGMKGGMLSNILNQTQGDALIATLHHLNSPITPEMIAQFGEVAVSIGLNNLRSRFQGYLEGFTHPSSVVRFMNRFDRLLSLFIDEGVETDNESNNNDNDSVASTLTGSSTSTLTGGKLPLKFKSKIKKLVLKGKKKMTGTGSAISGRRKIPIVDMINTVFKKVGEYLDNNPDKSVEYAFGIVRDLLEDDLMNYNDAEYELMDEIINNHLHDYLVYRTPINTPVNTPRGKGMKGGAVPPMPPKIKRGKKSIVPNNQIVVPNINPQDFGDEIDAFMERIAEAERRNPTRRNPPPPPRQRTQEELDEEAEDEAIEARLREEARLRGTGLIAGSSNTHIYPLSHQNILKMCKHLI